MLVGARLLRAAPSWADFDDEADAPVFDVLGDLATVAAPRVAAPPIPYVYPSLAPRATANLVPEHLPAPRQQRDDAGYTLALGSTAAIDAPPVHGAALPTSNADPQRPAARSASLFKPFKPPRRVAADANGRQPGRCDGSRPSLQDTPFSAAATRAASAQDRADRPLDKVSPADPPRLLEPEEHAAPGRQQLSIAHSEMVNKHQAASRDGVDAWPSEQADFSTSTRAPSAKASSQPTAQRAAVRFTTARAALPPAGGSAAVEELWPGDVASVSMADSGHASAIGAIPDAERTPAEGRSRKKAKRLYAKDDHDCGDPAHQSQACTLQADQL